jgi:hypothetical protein
MHTRICARAATCALLLLTWPVHGQTSVDHSKPAQEAAEEHESAAILELGAASNWDTSGGATTFAPNIAVETTPIEGKLELEAGVSRFASREITEWDVDFLFKKPWTLSRKAEFMLGVGPEWVHQRQNGATNDFVAAEVAGDFMFWPARKHRFGWFLEPAYDYGFSQGHPQSLGMSGGLLIAIH